MSAIQTLLPRPVTAEDSRPAVMTPMPIRKGTMYAIAFDLDTELLQQHYGNYENPSYNNAYAEIRKVLTQKHHFRWQQGSVYFGDPEKVNAVSCVLAAMDLAKTFDWFTPCVKDIRMLRIEEQNNLMDAIQQAIR